VLLLLILGGVGLLVLVTLGMRSRFQEVRRLRAEAQEEEDTQPP
jgi:hypothetical protein